MRIAPIVIKLRLANTRFGNFIAGAAEMDIALNNTLTKDMAFVIPLSETCSSNVYDSGINQKIVEQFGVVVALANDESQKDKTGITAYDSVHDVRSQIFQAILGCQIIGAESIIYYAGGKFLGIDGARFWYQFDFEFTSRLVDFDGYADIIDHDHIQETEIKEKIQVSQLDDFNYIYANYIQWPGADLPYNGDLPLADNFPDISLPDMAQWVDLTDDPNSGEYGRGFSNAFDYYKILNRR